MEPNKLLELANDCLPQTAEADSAKGGPRGPIHGRRRSDSGGGGGFGGQLPAWLRAAEARLCQVRLPLSPERHAAPGEGIRKRADSHACQPYHYS